MASDPPDIYAPDFVADLFDRCSSRYRGWSACASFGMIWLWRHQISTRLLAMDRIAALKGAERSKTPHVLDLMAGTGEVWSHVLRRFPRARITAIDISARMHDEAVQRLHGPRAAHIQHHHADVLTTDLPPDSADLIVCTFGLKTLSRDGQMRLARQIARALRPGGAFALIEASDPKGWALRPLYRWYLHRVLPLIERSVLRGAQDFAMIGLYTDRFENCDHMSACLTAEGLFAAGRSHVFGCATSVAGFKPVDAPQSTD